LMQTGALQFENEELCNGAKHFIENGKKQVRKLKLQQLYTLLDIDAASAEVIASHRNKPVVIPTADKPLPLEAEPLAPEPDSNPDVSSTEPIVESIPESQ
jgi:hypothetical protein